MSPKARKSPSKSSVVLEGTEGPQFNPTRLTFARRRRGFKKADLAALSEVHIRSVTGFESGEFAPSPDTLERLGAALDFPPEFFYGEDLDEPDLDTGSFRSMSKMTARQRDMALCQATLGHCLGNWIEAHFELPNPALPDLSAEPDPEAAAESLRQRWLIGVLPIRNVVHLLEAHGVKVFSLAIDAREVDAYSMWKGGRPYVFLNTNKTAEHSRFDAAHELGHLVLHRNSPHGRAAEIAANRFASAFLMPRASILANAPRYPSYDSIVKLKRIWATSVSALAYRLRQLKVITEWQYRGLVIEISKRGRSVEPNSVPWEASLILPMVFGRLHEEGISRASVARSLSIYPSELDQLLLGLVMTTIAGGGVRRTGGQADLQRIK